MEPRVQYARTEDGVNIAYWSMGDGLPVIMVPPIPWSHIRAEWREPAYQLMYESMLPGKQLIRYDNRGSGLSDRQVDDISVDAMVLDVLAVADKLGLDKFAVFGMSIGAPVAVAVAGRHPDRVTHLITWCGYSRSRDMDFPGRDGFDQLRDNNWMLYTQTVAHGMVAGWKLPDMASRYAAFMRECVDKYDSSIVERSGPEDLTEELKNIRCPALLMHREGVSVPPTAATRYMASQIANAELVIVEGDAHMPSVGNLGSMISAVNEFLGLPAVEVGTLESAAAPAAPSGLVTILFTDIEGSTGLTQTLGDHDAQEIVRAHNTIVRDALREFGGTEVKQTGDGMMASFPLASRAIECATAVQRQVARRNDEQPHSRFSIRIGLNAGEPVIEEADLYGTAVQVAARICSNAEGGEVLVSDVVRQLAAGKGFLFSDRGHVELKGFEEPVRLYGVNWREDTG